MPPPRLSLAVLTAVAMLAFAANSLLARSALLTTTLDEASFTALRLASGAVVLLALLALTRRRSGAHRAAKGTGWSALMLFTYAVAFSFAYRDIDTGSGALVLFAAAQGLMIGVGLWRGERASAPGLLLALGGLVAFLAPSATAPPLLSALLMAVAGFAWGGFSLLGRASGASPLAHTAMSFLWTLPLVLALLAWRHDALVWDSRGALFALLSGGVTSGLGYAVWYWVRVRLTAIGAGTVQLSVPVLAAGMGALALGEHLSWRGVLSAAAVLAGVAWVTLSPPRSG